MPGALGSIWTDFRHQVEGFDREKFTLVAWDPPGYGKSRPPERDFPTDFYERDAEYTYEFMKVGKYRFLISCIIHINFFFYKLLGIGRQTGSPWLTIPQARSNSFA